MQDGRRCELKFVWLRCRCVTDLVVAIRHSDFIGCGRGQSEQTADETTVVNAHEWVTGMPTALSTAAVAQFGSLGQVGATDSHAYRFDVGVQVDFG